MSKTGKKPEIFCDNCKCHRYTPCRCTKGTGSTRKERRDDRMKAYRIIHNLE